MRLLVDTNIFIAAVVEEPGRGSLARDLLNQDHDFNTTILNHMEIRSVLTKKKRIEQSEAERILLDIIHTLDGGALPNTAEWMVAFNIQSETLLYPADALLLAVARERGYDLVTFDKELLDHGAVSPDEIV